MSTQAQSGQWPFFRPRLNRGVVGIKPRKTVVGHGLWLPGPPPHRLTRPDWPTAVIRTRKRHLSFILRPLKAREILLFSFLGESRSVFTPCSPPVVLILSPFVDVIVATPHFWLGLSRFIGGRTCQSYHLAAIPGFHWFLDTSKYGESQFQS